VQAIFGALEYSTKMPSFSLFGEALKNKYSLKKLFSNIRFWGSNKFSKELVTACSKVKFLVPQES
jgi:hypothetical protein